MRKTILAAASSVVLLAGLAAPADAAPGSPPATEPGASTIVQGYTKDPRFIDNPGAVYDELQRGVKPEQLGAGAGLPKQLPRTAAEAKQMRERPTQSYTVDADRFKGGARVAEDPHNFDTCKKNKELADQPGGWVRNHFAWCEVGVAWAQVKPPGGGVEWVGATVYLIGYAKKGARPGTKWDRYVDFQIRTDQFEFRGTKPAPHLWEQAKDTATLEARVVCMPTPDSDFDSCQDGDKNGRKDTIGGWLKSGWSEAQLKSEGKAATKANGAQIQRATVWGEYKFNLPGHVIGDEDQFIKSDATGVRFDTAWYMYKVPKRGAIFDRVNAFLAFSNAANSGYKKAADHYAKALTDPGSTKPPFSDKQIPGGTVSDPLHRLYKGINDTNRLRYDRNYREAVKACDKWFAGWKGTVDTDGSKKQCDEFPFRSTYEGVARSMPEYKDDRGGPKYQDMYSVQPLSGKQNEAAGKLVCVFYSNDRILNGDAFHIKVRAPQAIAPSARTPVAPAAVDDPGDDPDVPNPDDDTCGNADGT